MLLKVLTYNLLAPPYLREPPPSPHVHSDDKSLRNESSFPISYKSRLLQQLQIIIHADADILFLQEVWNNDAVIQLLLSTLGSKGYTLACHAPRPSHKLDGVMLFVRETGGKKEASDTEGEEEEELVQLSVFDSKSVLWDRPYNRSLAMAMIECKKTRPLSSSSSSSSSSAAVLSPPFRFIAAACHFTFPEYEKDTQLRLSQAEFTVKELHDFANSSTTSSSATSATSATLAASGREGNTTLPMILGGDMNAADDAAIQYILANNFVSVFHATHGRHPVISHINHHCQGVGVDAIFIYPTISPSTSSSSSPSVSKPQEMYLRPVFAQLLPAEYPDDTPMERPLPQIEDISTSPTAIQATAYVTTNNNNNDITGVTTPEEDKLSSSSSSSSPSSSSHLKSPSSSSDSSSSADASETPCAYECETNNSKISGNNDTCGGNCGSSSSNGCNTCCESTAGAGASSGTTTTTPLLSFAASGIREVSSLSMHDYCMLSDHRPLLATVEFVRL